MQEAEEKVEKMREILKQQAAELKVLKEDHATKRKPASMTSNDFGEMNHRNQISPSTNYYSKQDKGDFNASRSMLSATVGPEKYMSIVKNMERNKLEGIQAKTELVNLKRTNEKEQAQDQITKHNELLISRLKIQVTERDREIKRLKRDYEK